MEKLLRKLKKNFYLKSFVNKRSHLIDGVILYLCIKNIDFMFATSSKSLSLILLLVSRVIFNVKTTENFIEIFAQ